MSRQEFIDRYMNKWVSRKLVVFIVGSIGLFTGHIESGDWVIISATYMSVEGIVSVITQIYKAKGGGFGNFYSDTAKSSSYEGQ